MIQTLERSMLQPGSQETPGTWIQITFTLDHGHYRMLWEKAEEKSHTIPALVRDAVIRFLQPSDSRFISEDLNPPHAMPREE
jgi:hypothetical protein